MVDIPREQAVDRGLLPTPWWRGLASWAAKALGGASARAVAVATGQVFGARSLSQGATLVASVLIARELGPGSFGAYAFCLALAMVLSDIPGSGLDISAVRVSAGNWAWSPGRARSALAVTASTKAGFGLTVSAFGLLAGDWLAADALGQPHLTMPLKIAALAALPLGLSESMMAILQTRERFGRMLALNVAIAALKLLPVIVLIVAGLLTLDRAFAVFLLVAYGSCCLSGLAAWQAVRGPLKDGLAAVRELFLFGRWLIPTTVLGAVTTNLDVVLLSHLAGPEATGLYSSARNLAVPIGVVGAAVGIVLIPRLGRMRGEEPIGAYVRGLTLRIACATALFELVVLFLAPILMSVVYGSQYAQAVAVFQILALAYGLQVTTWPLVAALITLDRPDVVAKVAIGLLGLMLIGYGWATPTFGAVGTAWVLFAGCVLCLAVYWPIVSRLLRGGDMAPRVESMGCDRGG